MRLIDTVVSEGNQSQKCMDCKYVVHDSIFIKLRTSKSMKMGLMLIIKVNINFEGLLTGRSRE